MAVETLPITRPSEPERTALLSSLFGPPSPVREFLLPGHTPIDAVVTHGPDHALARRRLPHISFDEAILLAVLFHEPLANGSSRQTARLQSSSIQRELDEVSNAMTLRDYYRIQHDSDREQWELEGARLHSRLAQEQETKLTLDLFAAHPTLLTDTGIRTKNIKSVTFQIVTNPHIPEQRVGK